MIIPTTHTTGIPGLTLPAIRAVQLEICTRWRRPNVIPGPVIANVLRGALGMTLRKLVCPEGWHDNPCPPCPLYRECVYGQVFVPTPPEDASQLRLQQDLPRPFVIEPPGMHPDEQMTPEGLTFRLMLFGTAIDQLPYFISTLDRLGSEGMGRDRVPFQIDRIAARHPAGDEILLSNGATTLSLPRQALTTSDLIARPWPVGQRSVSTNPESRRRILAMMGHPVEESPRSSPSNLQSGNQQPLLKLTFLTPLLLKSGSGIDAAGQRIPAREIRERPEMGVIIRRLRDRLSALSLFFGQRWDCPDFALWGTLADQVRIADSRTTWLTRKRHSTRTGASHELSGLVGQTTYEFPDQQTFDALLQLLKVGELLHVGKHAPWGNGEIKGSVVE